MEGALATLPSRWVYPGEHWRTPRTLGQTDFMNPRSPSVAKRIFRASGSPVGAIVSSAVILILVFLLLACAPPAWGFVCVCVGVVMKGAASLMEAIMKTEDESYWRSDAKKATAWLNVIAVILAFPPLLTLAAENLFALGTPAEILQQLFG